MKILVNAKKLETSKLFDMVHVPPVLTLVASLAILALGATALALMTKTLLFPILFVAMMLGPVFSAFQYVSLHKEKQDHDEVFKA